MKHCANTECGHLIRHGRFAEFIDSADSCADCGGPLLPGGAPAPAEVEYRELVTVYETSNHIQAHLIRSLLEQDSLDPHISGDALQGALGELPPTMLSMRVQVPIDQAPRAQRIIRGAAGRLASVREAGEID